jgi:tRNA modification GTPase
VTNSLNKANKMPPTLPVTHDAPTIVAQATASGPAGVAVIRLSGQQAWYIAERLFQGKPLQKGRIAYGNVVDPQTQTLIDNVILLPFKAPHSFTGEDVIEIQCHGGTVIPQEIVRLCLKAGAMLAPKGEFTLRAFLNGKLNLAQAEAIADAIHAEGKALAQVAVQTLNANTLGKRIFQLRDVLIDIQANIVAAMDYPEEVDEPDRHALHETLDALVAQASAFTTQSKRYGLMRHGLKIALLGQPNAGKSSLFNALLSQERSIVTELAGTTRDIVTERLVVVGVPVTLVDTAGLRHAQDVVEQLGVERSVQASLEADALLYLVDASVLAPDFSTLPAEDARLLSQLPEGTPLLKIINKVDTLNLEEQGRLATHFPDWQAVSVLSFHGVAGVLSWLESHVQAGLGNNTVQDAELCLNQRQLDCLHGMTTHVQHAQATLNTPSFPLDLVSIPLTDALRELDTLLGIDTSEAVLDEVFSRFCVGK